MSQTFIPPRNTDGTYIINGNTRVPAPAREQMGDRPHGTTTVEVHRILSDENVLIERRLFLHEDVDQLCVTTFEGNDTVNVFDAQLPSTLAPALLLQINQSRYEITFAHKKQDLVLTTRGGNDRIHIEDNVTVPITVFSGDGNDRIISAGKVTTLYAGAGDDFIAAIKGSCHIEAGDGDDEVHAHQDTHITVYGGAGNDDISGGEGSSFIDGGEGDDHIVGGDGHNILSGANGNDRIEAGRSSNVIYTGLGLDDVSRLKAGDITYFSQNSTLTVDCALALHAGMPDQFAAGELASHAIHSEPQDVVYSGIIVQGNAAFIARVNDDLRLLLNSPTGQRLLAELEKAAMRSGRPITIHEFFPTPNGVFVPDPAGLADTFIRNGQRGTPSYGAKVWYNTTDIVVGVPSIINLFHELCHAYNHVTGTLLAGTSNDGKDNARQENNVELQAVGLPTSAPPFDFDADPATPPTNTNPAAFTENGLRKELGLPPREHYHLLTP